MTHHKYSHAKTDGFALLMTMMVLAVVTVVTLATVELSLQQLALSVDSKDSEIAFHAANAGLECARYTRRAESGDFEAGTKVTFDCFGDSVDRNPQVDGSIAGIDITDLGSGHVYRYTAKLNWADGSSRCSEVDMLTMVVDPSATKDMKITGDGGSLSEQFPNYPTASKSCAPGAVCTIAAVAGYNVACPSQTTNLKAAGILKREVLLEF